MGSKSPGKVAEKLSERVAEGERGAYRVLDVAAGTGRAGAHLKEKGFNNIEALGKAIYLFTIHFQYELALCTIRNDNSAGKE